MVTYKRDERWADRVSSGDEIALEDIPYAFARETSRDKELSGQAGEVSNCNNADTK